MVVGGLQDGGIVENKAVLRQNISDVCCFGLLFGILFVLFQAFFSLQAKDACLPHRGINNKHLVVA